MNNTPVINTPVMQNNKKGCLRAGCLASFLVPIVIVAGLFMFFKSSRTLPDRFVLKVPIGGTLEEIRKESGLPPFLARQEPLSLQDLLFIFDHAASDSRVREVLLDIDGLRTSAGKNEELRDALGKLRASGKKVTAFLRSPEDSDYLLASACDSLVIEKGGFLMLDGFKAEMLFYAGTLGKIGVGFQAAQWKKYKSGIEPFVRTGPSRESLEEVNALLSEAYDDYLSYVSKNRHISRDSLENIINREAVMTPEKARNLGLVDGISSLWRLQRSMSRKITGKDPSSSDDEAIVGAGRYASDFRYPMKPDTRESIAVVTISGTIVRSEDDVMGDGGKNIDAAALRSALDTALAEKSVKAVVLRIDSPGGDALASSDMLEMLDSVAVRKPLVVSMSGVAASGGYMAALAGKTIYAQPLTVTGSIGVFALKPDMSGLLKKIGLERTVVTRGRFADANTPFKPFDEESLKKFVEASGTVYDDFIGKVAVSRKMRPAEADSVAGGRVWTGNSAKKVHLVDRTGGLFDAIREAQSLGGIDKARTPHILLCPARKNWLESFLKTGGSDIFGIAAAALKQQFLHEVLPQQEFSSLEAFYRMLMKTDGTKVLAVMPGEIVIY
jgi:protease IV